ncbi:MULTISPECIES: hypothetical protein [Brachybacterium]|uniref:Uncharacterized protein n=1 Tax=Brachybacterium kimchii TaxID=2942909 RepID=A0ABY4N8P1_9MICO|nr:MULTISPECIES: hypothetical protein [Brachybacterium]MCG7308287.1 hypothetical protein [Brachybacterium sp. ACRRE]UQN30466.1 hypothetical protein M4486_03750 [Brachybacterium kimchii]
MARKKTRGRNQVEDMLDTAVTVPSDTARSNPGKRRYAWVRRSIWTNLIVAPFSVVLLLAAIVLLSNAVTGDSEASSASANQTGRTEAESSLRSWLDSNDSIFHGAEISSWDGVTDTESVKATEQDVGYTLMTHQFTIRTSDGTYYHAAVRTAYAASRGVKVLSTPTITPIDASAVSDWDPQEPMDGWRTSGASDSTTSAITSWAKALTTSPNDLKLATRDGDSSHVYSSLTGVTAGEVQVITAASPVTKQGTADTSTVVATVNVELLPADSKGSGDAKTNVQYDVLVRGADTAAPYVTAWGPVGSGTGLSNYQNAVSLDGDVDSESTNQSGASDAGGADQTDQQTASDGGE